MRQVLFREAPQTAETYRAFEALAATSEPGANDLFFLPWLYGERSPFPNERLRGGWLGASLTTRSADLARSVFEGVSYNLAWSLQAMAARGVRPTSLAALGGGALSDLWLQSMADASGLPVLRLAEPRAAGAVGAAVALRTAVPDTPGLGPQFAIGPGAVSFAVAGDDPRLMLTAPIPATVEPDFAPGEGGGFVVDVQPLGAAGESASMRAVSVLFTSMASTLLMEDCSNSNWRESPPNAAPCALAMRMPSTLTPTYLGSRPPMRTARASDWL
jgi:hypothetical protein